MRALDPRLLREVRPARRYVALTAGIGVCAGALVVAQALLLADVIADVVAGGQPGSASGPLGLLAAVVVGRAVLAWVQERYGDRAATAVIADLRRRVLAHAVALGPAFLGSANRSSVTTLVTVGLEGLRPYLSRYLPQLLSTALVTPALLVVIGTSDVVSGIVIAVTLPLVPVFMALVGAMTQDGAARRLTSMQRLHAQVLDLLVGLPTLVALGRERGPAAKVRALGDAHRRATNATLRTAFLSALVLDVLTTLSVALVAVGVGLRLLSGSMDLRTSLFVLILAPEVYLPLRQVGAAFHASTDGLAAIDQAFDVLARPSPTRGTVPAPDLRTSTIGLRDVVVRHDGRARPAPDGATLTLRPGTVTAIIGGSGSGKSTLTEVILGLRAVDGGTVDVVDAAGGRTALASIEARSWLDQTAWLGQRPIVVPGTVLDNALLFTGTAVTGTAPNEELDAAARASGLADVVAGLPHGWATRLGAGGLGLSAGQRQRLALTRVLLSDAALVVLDEPSAHLDEATEAVVRSAVEGLRDVGRTVLVVAHRPALASIADQVVDLTAPTAPTSLTATRLADAAAVDGFLVPTS